MIKQLIRKALNTLPRPVLQRAAGILVPIAGLAYAGRGRECPVCGARLRRFMPYGYVTVREDALCPRCLSLERHRLLWMYMQRCGVAQRSFDELPRHGEVLLHIAPEACIKKPLRKAVEKAGGRYVTADLESPLADLHFDVQQIPLPDGYADVIICNHLLEHVADDRRALAELFRIMKPGGCGVMLSPVDESRAETFEDDSITDPAERTRLFGQYDHRRIYGRDYPERLRSAGFEVEIVDFAAQLTAEERTLRSVSDEKIYAVRKP